MGRRKRKTLDLKPFCYYCDRQFEDEKVLLLHQKARHFKCSRCNRKLDTATGLVVHLLQVHKETLTKVPNARKDREGPEMVVHGMSGIPPELIAEKKAKLAEEVASTKTPKLNHTVFGSDMLVLSSQLTSSMLGLMPQNPASVDAPELVSNAFASQLFAAGGFNMQGLTAPGGGGAVPHPLANLIQQTFMPHLVRASAATSPPEILIPQVQYPPPTTLPTPFSLHLVNRDDHPPPPPMSRDHLVTMASQPEKIPAPRPVNGFLVYDDAFISMEERRAALPKYTYRVALVMPT